jgi:hypothetical protein
VIVAPYIPNLGIRPADWPASCFGGFIPGEKTSDNGWVNSTVGLDTVEKNKVNYPCQVSNNYSIIQPVVYNLTTL